jgi:hypothetical protein
MITEESSVVMIAHAANMTMQRQREAAKKKQPQASHRPSSAKKAKLPPCGTVLQASHRVEMGWPTNAWCGVMCGYGCANFMGRSASFFQRRAWSSALKKWARTQSNSKSVKILLYELRYVVDKAQG